MENSGKSYSEASKWVLKYLKGFMNAQVMYKVCPNDLFELNI